MREEIEALEHHTEVFTHLVDVGLWIGDFLAIDDNMSAGWFFKQIDAAQEGTLTGTGRSDDGDDFPIFDGFGDALRTSKSPKDLCKSLISIIVQ